MSETPAERREPETGQPDDAQLADACRRAGIVLGRLPPDASRKERTEAIARAILIVFDDYYIRSRQIPYLVRDAFETRTWPVTFRLSRERLTVYSRSLAAMVDLLQRTWRSFLDERGFWVEIEACFLDFIHGRYEADLAYAFMRSTRRAMRQGEWAPVAYFAGRDADRRPYEHGHDVTRTYPVSGRVTPGMVEQVLLMPRLKAPFRDLSGDAGLLAARMNAELDRRGARVTGACALEMIDAGFFRNRGAYLVGRLHYDEPVMVETSGGLIEQRFLPIGMALLNEQQGLFADAILFEADELHAVFSSALANLHVTDEAYHQLARFLHEIMPKRPLGLHYSTIGFNHIGKVAVMRELRAEQQRNTERLDFAPGFRGTVAIGFTTPSSGYVLKVIRDTPAAGYKWDTFGGVEAVLEKYRVVHEADRAGSMLDNVIYDNVRLEREWFADEVLQELANAAPGSVKILHRSVLFQHLIVQMKLTPLPVFLKTATFEEACTAIRGLGNCIRNNAAANIFNKDLDARNYGISGIGKVYLFDYDAVEPLTGVKVRTNLGRIDGEEDIPDWFFEEGTIFLPEEMLVGLRIEDPEQRRYFRQVNAELMTPDYWEGMQRALNAGLVPKVRAYPLHRRLRATGPGKPGAGQSASLVAPVRG